MTEPSHAVFLSYASQDAEAAQRICEALRAAGIEVWFDQSALRGGDVWDQTIRKQIKTCVLFIPLISRHTHERDEGYFRLEWKLAVDRSHLMTGNRAFLLPVVIDDTREDDENVPDRFKDIHWARLPAGETPPAFVERVRRLVSPERLPEPAAAQTPVSTASGGVLATETPLRTPRRSTAALLGLAVAVAVAVAVGYLTVDRYRPSRPPGGAGRAETPAAQTAAPVTAAFHPPPHSIAVLPFVNMSGDKAQDYFSDGLSEELLNDLARINELQVAARTSAFSFKGKDTDIGTIARKLNVGAVLEGSVRRSAHTVRVTAQLIDAVTGFHLWSQTYDRDLGDVLRLQTDVAAAVASALKVTLLGDETEKIVVGGTHNAAALDAYLRAMKTYWTQKSAQDVHAAIDGYTEAIRLDPEYALAYASRALAHESIVQNWATSWPVLREAQAAAQADARKAIELTPRLSEGHLALGVVDENLLEFTAASGEFERALALGPGNARVLRDYGVFAVATGHSDSGLTSLQRAVVLDPLNTNSYSYLGGSLMGLRRYDEAISVFKRGQAISPDGSTFGGALGEAYYFRGDLQEAASNCETAAKKDPWALLCVAVTYDKLGRHADAKAALTQARSLVGDTGAAGYSRVYAQWGDTTEALKWLDTAMRLRDPELQFLKTHPGWDPLRKEPRFQAAIRELKFPE